MPKLAMASLPALSLALFGLAACTESSDSETVAASGTDAMGAASLQSDEDRAIYSLGAILAGNVAQFELTESEVEPLVAGFRDAVLEVDPGFNPDSYRPNIDTLLQERTTAAIEREEAASAEFAAEYAARPGAEVSDTGVIVIPMEEGDGEMPEATDTVRVHYHGTLRDGSVFDSSVERDETIAFGLNQVIPCWTEGVQKIRVGGKATLVCPADTAYGDRGSPPTIPGGSTLVFEVELIGIE